jgi:hypothetical protein
MLIDDNGADSVNVYFESEPRRWLAWNYNANSTRFEIYMYPR